MRRLYAASKYAKPYERYCAKRFPDRKAEICAEAEKYYAQFLKQMPDLGGKENMMAANMEDWFTILSFYEASGHELGGEALLEIKSAAVDSLRFLGRLIDGNRSRWPYRLMEKFYIKYQRQLREHRAKGEWTDSWDVELNPRGRAEGVSFNLIGCPIARHAKEHGYEELLPYLCRTDHMLTELLHVRLIRTQTEALGGALCDYWYVGDKSAAAQEYKDLKKI